MGLEEQFVRGDPTILPVDPRVDIGHVHRNVADLERALAFYGCVLGFELQQRMGDAAAFASAGGCHHLLGLYTWESGGGFPPRGTTGLYHVAIRYPDRASLADALRPLVAACDPFNGASDHGVSEAARELARLLYTADARGRARFVSMQNHYNLAYREEEREMLPLCQAEGVGVIPWSPLARGFLAGARRRDDPRPSTRARNDPFADEMYYTGADFDVVEALVGVAAARGEPPARVALAWLLHQPAVVAPIVGATKPAHLDDAAAAVAVRLSADEVAALEAPYVPHRVLGHG